ncbi:hypothetical protein [Micromonospora chersina]|uniref:hypothetical protein n=1 Tax=Micromonospora chersina TaxID=47854 RepID=UPI003D8B92C8
MTAEFTVTVRAESEEELGEALMSLAAKLGSEAPAGLEDLTDPTEASSAANVPVMGWTPKRARKFVGLITEDCRAALRFISENAPEVQVAAVIQHLGLSDGYQLGGRMSSIGHALNAMPKGIALPVARKQGIYYIDEKVAKLLLDAIEDYEYA